MSHKWKNEIIAWAKGEQLQWRPKMEEWRDWPFTTGSSITPQFNHPDYEFRIVPKMRRVTLESGEIVKWPEPIREPPELNTPYWLPYWLPTPEGTTTASGKWQGLKDELDWLHAGIIQTTKAGAEQQSYALRKINGATLPPEEQGQ